MTVQHNPARHRFEIAIGDSTAVLEYEAAEKRMVITHTEVPPALRGRGLAEELTRAALAWIDDHGLQVEPRCSYAARFIEGHPEFQRLLAT